MMSVVYRDRARWGADESLPRLGAAVSSSQFRGLVIHHDVIGTPHPAGHMPSIDSHMRRLQVVRPDLGLDVPYSFVVFAGVDENEGVICEGRGTNRTGAHTRGLNSSRWGIAFAGNTNDDPVTPGMIDAVRYIGTKLIVSHGDPLHATTGHGAHASTACPGHNARAALPAMQPPFSLAPSPTTEVLPEMILIDDPEGVKPERTPTQWLSWIHDGRTYVRQYSVYRPGEGVRMPGASVVILEALAKGTMTRQG